MSLTPRFLVLLTSLAAVFLFAAGCGDDDSDSEDSGDTPETLELVSDPEGENFAVVDLGEKGGSVGDMYVFDGPMLDTDGEEAGQVYGTQTSISLDDGGEVVQAMITYDLGDGNQILVGGTAEYDDGDGLIEGEEYVRPIIGGTGDYADAGGTMTTVRQTDGAYEQTFTFGD